MKSGNLNLLESLGPVQACNGIALFHKRHDSEKEKLLDTKCVFWFSLQLLSAKFLVLRSTARDVIIHVHWSPCEVPVILLLWLCIRIVCLCMATLT